jgi:hypothetical protein
MFAFKQKQGYPLEDKQRSFVGTFYFSLGISSLHNPFLILH